MCLLIFVDDFSRTWVYYIEEKIDASIISQKKSGHALTMLCTDRGGEYTSNKFDYYCKK